MKITSTSLINVCIATFNEDDGNFCFHHRKLYFSNHVLQNCFKSLYLIFGGLIRYVTHNERLSEKEFHTFSIWAPDNTDEMIFMQNIRLSYPTFEFLSNFLAFSCTAQFFAEFLRQTIHPSTLNCFQRFRESCPSIIRIVPSIIPIHYYSMNSLYLIFGGLIRDVTHN